MELPKRFWLFIGDHYYTDQPADALQRSFDSLAEINALIIHVKTPGPYKFKMELDGIVTRFDWYNIADTATGEWIVAE